MKRILLIFFLTHAAFLLRAQNVNFEWAKQMSGTGNGGGSSVAIDAAGNVYTLGSFRGTIDFDPGPGTYNLTNTDWGIFISKLDSAGKFIWAKQIKGNTTGQVWGNGITLDAGGNMYATGYFTDTVDFDPGPNIFTLGSIYPNLMVPEGFIFKLDAAGNFVWAIKMPGAGGDVSGGLSIVSDSAGNVYMSGGFGGIQDFDPGPDTLNIEGGYNNIYIAKFNAAGDFIWAKTPDVSSPGFNWLDGAYITLDAAGNVYCTGDFAGNVDFDPGGGIFSLVAQNWNIYI